MSHTAPSTVARLVGGFLLAAAVIAPLSACAPEDGDAAPSASPSNSPSASPSGSPSASPEPSVDPSPSSAATPVGAGCLDLVSLETMYEFDPNFGLDDGYSPPPGSLAARAASASGVACGWVQQTSGETIEIAAARPPADEFASLRADAGSDRSFSVVEGRGVVQVFAGTGWVVASSSYFGSAEDAAPLVDSAIAALG